MHVRLLPVATDADRALRAQVADLLTDAGADVAGVPARRITAADVRTGRLCPACGSSAHGPPWARVAGQADGDGVRIGVSLSRSGPHLLTAVHLGGGIGVDIEEIAAVDARWDPSLVLAPGEEHLARTSEGRARLWAGKEAVLKLLGTGLRTPMPDVRLADVDVRRIAAPPGFVAAIALPGGPPG
ncbi:hypothetical protein GCM10009592_16840 [Brachybacterium rhamnosum]